jgi:hypothetical protein
MLLESWAFVFFTFSVEAEALGCFHSPSNGIWKNVSIKEALRQLGLERRRMKFTAGLRLELSWLAWMPGS